MKTFLFDTIKGIDRLNKKLDAVSAICNKEWLIYNDDPGLKEVYIFKKDGSLIASFNGKVTYSSWEYLASNIIFKLSDGEAYMFKPVAYNGDILVLQLHGENRLCFMLNIDSMAELNLLSLPQIKRHLIEVCNFDILNAEEKVEYDRHLEKINEERKVIIDEEWEKEKEGLPNLFPFILVLICIIGVIIALIIASKQ